jgi:aminopeptidase N
LLDHTAYTQTNPNKIRALIGAFASGNPLRFNAKDGSGYNFLADQVCAIDKRNPQVAARLLGVLGQWRRFDVARGKLMHDALERIAQTKDLSRDCLEIATKSLA